MKSILRVVAILLLPTIALFFFWCQASRPLNKDEAVETPEETSRQRPQRPAYELQSLDSGNAR